MLREAELFVMAETMVVEVLGRIRDDDLAIEIPPIVGVTGEQSAPMGAVVDLHLRDDATVPGALAGTVPAAGSDDRQVAVVRTAEASIAAAVRVAPPDATVAAAWGNVPVADYLLRLTVVRSLVAHYVAAYLGSTACPLPEELARPLWQLTAPDAYRWRATGVFREPTPVPDQASWRDTFLRTAGHEPHPLGH